LDCLAPIDYFHPGLPRSKFKEVVLSSVKNAAMVCVGIFAVTTLIYDSEFLRS
jgi:hypothetical protein